MLRAAAVLALAAALVLSGACASTDSVRIPAVDSTPVFDAGLYVLPQDVVAEDLDLEIRDREVVRGTLGERLLRIRFSFVSMRGYPLEEDVIRSSGAVFFPVDEKGRARPANPNEVLVTEFPPGSSGRAFDLFAEYGERAAIELGVAAAIIDLRGGLAASLRSLANPSAGDSAAYTSEDQFALVMLREFAETADFAALYEYQLGQAWLRAIKAMNRMLADEVPGENRRYMIVGEGYAALGAFQAAAVYRPVQSVVACGWPMDWLDLHYVRWRRWEREARWFPLEPVQPCPWSDSRALLSFLSSSYSNPDPGCPTCVAGGDLWMAQFNYADLKAAGALRGVRAFFLYGDSDPLLPIDLEIRSSVPEAALRSFPHPLAPGDLDLGPLAADVRLPYAGLAYLRGETSTIACADARRAVLAWMQHLAGYRDIPRVLVEESEQDGDVRLDVRVLEGNTEVSGVEVYLTEIDDGKSSDFRYALHRTPPEAMSWRRYDAIYGGPSSELRELWRAFIPITRTYNRAYQVVVRDRVGNLEAAHALPTRPLWYLGDPALGRVRF
jgi:hypothetical protein